MSGQAFNCWCYLDVVAKDGEATFLRGIELPFPPWAGLRIIFDDEQSDYFVVSDVEYLVETESFSLTGTDEIGEGCPCGPADNCCLIDKEVEFREAQGWEVNYGPRRGGERFHHRPWVFDPGETVLGKPDGGSP